jgi:hypothetical protein
MLHEIGLRPVPNVDPFLSRCEFELCWGLTLVCQGGVKLPTQGVYHFSPPYGLPRLRVDGRRKSGNTGER